MFVACIVLFLFPLVLFDLLIAIFR